jgi:endonuclease YncB( thermonuclease family)
MVRQRKYFARRASPLAIAAVWCGGIDANAEQVRRGMAWVFRGYVKDRSLYPLQDAARSSRIGLWADAAPVPPWE